MVKTTIKEVTEKFDKNGTLIERLTREEFVEDDENCGVVNIPSPTITTPTTPYTPATPINPWHITTCCNSDISEAVVTATKAISSAHECDEINGRITAHVSNIQPLDSINDVINKTELRQLVVEYDNDSTSTENAFKQAVSRCIR